mmetsp:Transcript_36221/g.73961  ORF Transcript_36221/g.73961 Transcript_36221/m.73961 type:complete len:276 (-) Transcript_36221:352-1179(-)
MKTVALFLSINTTVHAFSLSTKESQADRDSFAFHRRDVLLPIIGSIPAATLISPAAASDELEKSITSIYDSNAATYDDLYSDSIISRTLDFTALRKSLLSQASGSVLELGVGTGLNLPHYPDERRILTSYDAVDISPNMLRRARSRFENDESLPASMKSLGGGNFQTADASSLPFQNQAFDTVVDTFGLCVFQNPIAVLKEARRVLKPGGHLLLLEHQDSLVGKILDPTRGLSDVSKTCRYNDDVVGMVKDAGFKSILSVKSRAGGFLCEIVAGP